MRSAAYSAAMRSAAYSAATKEKGVLESGKGRLASISVTATEWQGHRAAGIVPFGAKSSQANPAGNARFLCNLALK